MTGAQNLKYMMSYNSEPKMMPPYPPSTAPLSVVYGPDGAKAGDVVTQARYTDLLGHQ